MPERIDTEAAQASGPDPDLPSKDELFTRLYLELRHLADRELRRFPGADVSPTTLVHEVYLNVAVRERAQFAERDKFLGYTARAMRGLLIDFARRRQTFKRGSGFHITQLNTNVQEDIADCDSLARLSATVDELGRFEPRLAEVVDLKYFCGFSFAEIAALRGASIRTVKRDWEKARLLLYTALNEP